MSDGKINTNFPNSNDDGLALPWAVLFDIDGTLIDSGGAGGQALLRALQHEFDVPDAKPVRLHGRTDLGIVNELLALNQIDVASRNFSRICNRYFQYLPGELQARPGCVLPGVLEILTVLNDHPACLLGLLTGNLPASAELKLQHFGLWQHFEFGIFGDQAEHRPDLCLPALAMVKNRCGQALPGERIIIVGDTPLDVELANAMGARCLAVCTGGFSEYELLAAGDCQVVEDLSQTEAIFDWIFSQTELKQ